MVSGRRTITLTAALALVASCMVSNIEETSPRHAPLVPPESPEEVVARAMNALKENRLADFAVLIHEDALEQLRATIMSVAEVAHATGRFDEFAGVLRDVNSLDQLKALTGAEILVAILDGAALARPAMRVALRNTRFEVLGHVPEGDDIIHVVYRGTLVFEEVTMRQMQVASLKSHEDGWRMLLTGDIENTAATLRRRFRNLN